jgi:hypothetical protein
MLKAPIKLQNDEMVYPEKGTPQGGILSPLLSNIVLNELDWWIASQWENLPTRHAYKCCVHENGSVNKSPIYSALRKTGLKECYIVRYADDFKLFCRNRADAQKLFIATQCWLKERLGLEISPEKSKIINLKRHYSEFLGFKLKAHPKGKQANGQTKYVVTSHISDKAHRKIQERALQTVKNMAHPDGEATAYKLAGVYNAFVMGAHQYYSIATEVSKDFHKISFHVNRTLKAKMKQRLKRPDGKTLKCKAILERYGMSRELRCIGDIPVVPIGYVQHRNPMWKRASVNKFTAEGRQEIHKNLRGINMEILLYLMRNPIVNRSIEYNDNRISMYSGQMGKCAVTGRTMPMMEIHCHHKTPVKLNGDDSYGNLTLMCADIHRLIHATLPETITKLLEILHLTAYQIGRVNNLRKLCELAPIAEF